MITLVKSRPLEATAPMQSNRRAAAATVAVGMSQMPSAGFVAKKSVAALLSKK